MKKVNAVEVKNILDVYDIQQGEVTTSYWPTENVKLIKMKDGTFVLGIDIQYKNQDDSFVRETHRIYLDENNVPYIQVGMGHDFTEENCDFKLQHTDYVNGGYQHYVEGYPVMTLDDGVRVKEKSVFSFMGECLKKDKIRDYFGGYYRVAGLNQKGMALVLHFVNDPNNHEKLEQRIKGPTETEVQAMQREVKELLDGFLNGIVRENIVKDKVDMYALLTEGKGMMPDGVILCDLETLEHIYTKPQSQPQ